MRSSMMMGARANDPSLGGQLVQVLFALSRRRWNRCLGLAACVLLPVAFLKPDPRVSSQRSAFAGMIILMSFVGSFCIAVHLREILERPESRLIPRFTTAHFLCMVGLNAILSVVAPAIPAWWGGYSPLTTISFGLLFSGLASMIGYFPAVGVIIPLVLAGTWVCPAFYSKVTALRVVLDGKAASTWSMLIIGLATHTALLVHVLRLPVSAGGPGARRSFNFTCLGSYKNRHFLSVVQEVGGQAVSGRTLMSCWDDGR